MEINTAGTIDTINIILEKLQVCSREIESWEERDYLIVELANWIMERDRGHYGSHHPELDRAISIGKGLL